MLRGEWVKVHRGLRHMTVVRFYETRLVCARSRVAMCDDFGFVDGTDNT